MKFPVLAVAAALLAVAAPGAERWRLRYFYDTAENVEFNIVDIAFSSPQRGMAVGALSGSGRKDRPYAVATADGGETWAPVRLPDFPITLFFLNDKAGWLAGHDNIWYTADFGGTWRKLGRAPGTLRVHFRDEQRGWAIGTKKAVRETSDGGATWKDVAAAAQPKASPENTVYGAVAFANPDAGMIAGWSRPPRRGDRSEVPDWVDPESARREWPGLTIMLETKDGGAHWNVAETSMFGQITSVSLAPDGRGLGLVEFFEKFDYPSEVYRIEWRTGRTTRVFRRKDRAVTDVLLQPDGPAYLAAIEPPGTLLHSPIPGKLKILKSGNLDLWEEMPVDYRAIARRATLAAAGPRMWVATDTGMILQLGSE
jgi:hypothetical protein